MIKKLLFALTVLFSTQAFAIHLPEQFSFTERWLSWTTTFDVESNHQKFGTVNRKLLSWTPQYHLKDLDNQLLAVGKMRFWNLLAFFDVMDADGVLLGTLEEKFTWFFPTFEIVSPRGLKLAQASLNFWGTRYTLIDLYDGHTLATMSRPFFRLKNNWTVNIIDSDGLNDRELHPHMLLVMLAYQVDREYWNAARRRNENNYDQDDYVVVVSSLPSSKDKLQLPERPEVTDQLMIMLEDYSAHVDAAEPTEEDFNFVETLVIKDVTDAEAFIQTTQELFTLFDSSKLTDGQKAALYLMLRSRLEN